MLSAGEVETEAWRAGADAFLKKPDDIGRLSKMVTRLLSKGRKPYVEELVGAVKRLLEF
jgi:hypothetical protein